MKWLLVLMECAHIKENTHTVICSSETIASCRLDDPTSGGGVSIKPYKPSGCWQLQESVLLQFAWPAQTVASSTGTLTEKFSGCINLLGVGPIDTVVLATRGVNTTATHPAIKFPTL